jgi:peptidyl-prolyl cis-trans isomerase A (cyclophilin A)
MVSQLSFGQENDSASITIQTEIGDIKAVLYLKKAPLTCLNFLSYIDQAGKEGGTFYRTVTMDNQPDKKVKIEVIQGGFDISKLDSTKIRAIPLERTNETGIPHLNGTLSMARDDPDSGTTEFFICVSDQPSLDFGGARNPDGQGFAAFGRVTEGMDIVRRIQSSHAEEQKLSPPIKIIRIYR